VRAASAGLGALSVSHARSWTAALLTPAAVPLAALRALPWASSGASGGGIRRGMAVLRTTAVTAVLLGVFGALLASADAAFARVVELALPELRLGELPARLVLAGLVTTLVLGTTYLAVAPPPWSRVQVPPGRPARRGEWLVPVGALDPLAELSADAVPELDRLPEPLRSCALAPVAQRLADSADSGWAGANAARSAARRLLAERPVRPADPAVCAAQEPGR